MHVKALTTPASAPGDYTWDDETSVVEVPDALGHQLVRITHQFREVLPGDPDHPDTEDLLGVKPPAKHASTAEWAAYAQTFLEVPKGTGRDAIIKLLADAGHPTE